jgi:hypothetical protein
MGNGGYTGAVPERTMAQMKGQMGFEEGVARIFTAGQPASVVQSAMESARQRGAMAAENIRARYFQAEFKQVQEARIKPLQEELKGAIAQRDAALKMTVMPVNRVLNPGETRAAIDATEPPPPPQLQAVPGKAKADGTQAQETVEMPGQPIPNPALAGPQMNAMVSEEALSFIDPVSGDPVRVSSARGIDIARLAEHEFWGTFGRISTEMMNVYSEYKGNPFAEGAMNQMMDQIIKQANMATTGAGDPMEAQKRFEGRQAWELEQSKNREGILASQQARAQSEETVLASQQERTQRGLGIGEKEAGYQVGATRARDMAQTRPEFRKGFLGDDLASKSEWDAKDTVQAAAAVAAFDTAEKERIARLDKSGIFRIPNELVGIPENWQTSIREGYSAWRPVYGQEITTIVNTTANRMRQMPKEERDAILTQFGADSEVIWHADHNNYADPNLKAVIEAYAQSTGAAQLAEKRTMLRVLPEVTRQQPELMNVIQGVLSQAMDYQDMMAEQGAVDDDGNPYVPAPRERMLADPYPYFMMAVTGDGNWPMDVKPRESEDALYLLNKREAAPPPQEQPTGPLAPSILETPPTARAAQPWDVQYTNEQAAPTLTEFERVYGKGATNPLAAIGSWRGYSDQPRSFSPGTAFDTQNRPIDQRTGALVELTNPYVNLPIAVLESLRRSMPDGTAGVELIDEAIALATAASDTVAVQ